MTKKNKQQRSVRRLMLALVILAGIFFASNIRRRDAERQAEHAQRTELTATDSLIITRTNPGLPEQLLDYEGMTVSFNPAMHQPNWVAWELTADETRGETPRYNKFAADPDVEASADPWDYNYSGYDRGHMAPAGDMKWSDDAMRHTFFMTNICPQSKALNTGAWKSLEEKCRTWARADSSIIIICGPVLTDTITEFIGDSRVAVPQRFFKVILSPNARPMRAIGFIMNNGRVEGGMQRAAVSIDEVEAVTGHDFFAALPDSIENEVESKCDFHLWSTIR